MDYDNLSDEELLQLRNSVPKNHFMWQHLQDEIAPIEHGRQVRSEVASNPITAPLYGITIPGYDLAKTLNKSNAPATLSKVPNGMTLGALALKHYLKSQVGNARSNPSLSSLFEGYKGMGQGLSDWYNAKR